MPNTLLPKRSAVANKVPTTSDLASGELGVNMADRKVYINNGGSIVQVGAGLLSALADVNLTGLATGNSISWNGTAWVASSAGAGTVTSVVAGTGLTGGTINTTGTIALATSGVTAGTYTKITVDEYGRATAGTSLGSSDVTTALGFTPANKAGDTFTGNVLISSGALGVNTTFLNNYLFRIGGNITGATTRGAGEINATAQSDVTSEARGLVSTVSTAAASFTIGQTSAFFAAQGTIGAGSAITTQVGYLVSSNFIGGTNNYGFRGAIPSGTNRFNLYMDGTADNFLAGSTGIGGTPSATARLRVVGSGASNEVARLEGGTLAALLLINQTDAPGVNANRSGISLRKNNVEGGAISVEYNGTRGIVYYDATGATGQHAFYVNGNDRLRLNQFGGLSFDGAGYGTAGQFLKSGGASAAAAWGSLTSSEVTTALGFTPYNSTNPNGYITNTGNARVGVENNGTLVGTRRNINFIPGTGISLSISDDAANEEVDITITSTVTGGVTSFNTRTGAVTLSSSDVTTALGYTPYNSSNPSGYITSSGSISGNAATATNISNTGTVTLASATESNSIYITAPSYATDTPVKLLNFDWYGNLFSMGNIRSGSTPSNGFGIYYTASGGSRTEIARFGTGGSFNAVGAITQNGSQVLHAGNFSSYALPLSGGTLSGTLRLGDSSNGLYLSSGRLTVRSESADNVANFAFYGLYLPVTGQTAGLYVESPIEARTGLRMGSGAANGTITVGADTGVVGNRIVQRDGNGYIYANHINFNTSESENPTINSFFTSNGDGWSRKSSLQHVKNSIRGVADGTWSINVTGSAGSVPWSGISSRPSNIMYYQSFTLDANTMDSNATGFTYSVNAPYTGPIARFSTGGGYDLWLNAPYIGGNELAFRTRNGDNGTLNPWRAVLHAGNFTSYSPGLTGSGASGTWGINITGSAGSVAWGNISSRPDVVVNGDWNRTLNDLYNNNWFRNNASNTGLYNQATTMHLSSGSNGYWDVSSTTSVSSIRFYTGGHLSALRGYVYADNSNQIGFLNSGGNWSLRVDNSGNATATGNVAANSDERLKTDWAGLPADFIERLASVKHGTYTRIDSGERQAGSSAQDWQALLPEVVSTANDEQGTLSLAYGNAALVSAVALAKRVVEQDARIARLEALIETLIGE